ncbi:MAG TPA: hypothetical protein VN934_03550 [Candidatus Tumulicola sp.]|nr:hypothetical protein [Candidatus Tumulicola sp.]
MLKEFTYPSAFSGPIRFQRGQHIDDPATAYDIQLAGGEIRAIA